ncbi:MULTISPECIES: carbohydrate ABC transporter permease [Streptomyces]|uniref:Putative ABC transporter permease protein n=1 Tax=Streptomyces albus (strain ATCC 21838 / DSM 41398 / FERM P-419 / JCM 4703 / NBRC 107858) TaxID=1081613 RepID=A0A0B5EGV6_STRA4|nr:sugar ABC transporter permease [Streptomyces sp. SCSIO ZS0520]AJE81353.1 putative ABC transporter permease protein [Streptomyces albus]AOU75669.1 putative ABC transporter permease protein [Streptomyces albus]AYN31471.1 sugar ABC transporter permease [Streptomyces albus]
MAAPLTEGPAPRRRRGPLGAPLLLLAPFFLLFTACTLVPIGYAIHLSLYREQRSGLGFGGVEKAFTGLGNYRRALEDEAFRDGFLTLAQYCVLYIPLMIGLSLALALLLDSTLARARRFFQLALFLPHAVPGIIAALIWMYLYTPGVSPVIGALDSAGYQIDLLGHPVPAVVNIALWEWTGYNLIIFFAALQAIPREVLEAAVVDGAGPLRTALSIKVPLIRASLTMVGLFTVIGSLQLFTEPMILHDAAPGVVTTWTPNMYAYTAAFERNDYGLAAAASVLLALTAAVLSFAVTRFGGGRFAKAKEARA